MEHNNGPVLLELLCDEHMINMIKPANIDLFNTYFNSNNNNSIACTFKMKLALLYPAIDTGNVELVRLLIKHNCFKSQPRNGSLIGELSKPGVSLEMLKVLHAEFDDSDHLFDPVLEDLIWIEALKHSIYHNMLDSVQYIIKHKPRSLVSHQWEDVLEECIQLLSTTKHGNVNILQSLLGTSYLYPHLDQLIETLVDYGHVDILKYIHSLDYVKSSSKRSICGHFDVGFGKLIVTPKAAIITEDLEMAEALLPQVVEIGAIIWQQMSMSMAMLITHPSHKHLQLFNHTNLMHMFESMSMDGSQITVDMVLNFIQNCHDTDVNGDVFEELLKVATRISPLIMNKILTTFRVPFVMETFAEALNMDMDPDKTNAKAKDIFDTLSIIFDRVGKEELDVWSRDDQIKEFANELIGKASLDTVVLILDNLPRVKNDIGVCGIVMANPNNDVVQYVINQFTLEDIQSPVNIQDIIHMAYCNDNLYALNMLCTMKRNKATIGTLIDASEYNAYHVLEHYLASIEFNSLPKVDRLRTINSIMLPSLMKGHSRIVNHSQSLIKLIQSNKKRDREESPAEEIDESIVVNASPRLETAIHKVFSDGKICGMIMEQVGIIYDTIGVPTMKGSILCSKNSLENLIEYGASQWFHAAYQSFYTHEDRYNSTLLEKALLYPNQSIMDTLLKDPKMLLPNNEEFMSLFIELQSECSQPGWERALEQYISITFQTPAHTSISQDQLIQIKHPSFLNKLLTLGYRFDHLIKSKDSVDTLITNWFDKPWAVDMFKVLRANSLVTTSIQRSLLKHSIKLNIIDIVRYCMVDVGLDIMLGEDLGRHPGYTLLLNVVEPSSSSADVRELILSHYPLESITMPTRDDVGKEMFWVLNNVAMNGNLDLFVKLLNTTQAKSINQSAFPHLSIALQANNHLELVNYILETEPIHAIKAGKKDVIEFMLNMHMATDYHGAFHEAMIQRDIDTAKIILDKIGHMVKGSKKIDGVFVCHLCKAARHDKLTGNDIVDMVKAVYNGHKGSIDVSSITQILLSISCVSSEHLQPMIDLLNCISDDDIEQQLGQEHYKMIIDDCVVRGDTQSFQCILDLAATRSPPFKPSDLIPNHMSNSIMMDYILDKGYLKLDGSSLTLKYILEWAFENDYVDVVKSIHQRCTSLAQLKRYLPTLNTIQQHLDAIVEPAYEHGYINIIELYQRVSKK
ncbi:hypothetical protein SAMD00019534_049140 [Acytostelium subglobosum LB1]|uniref:hypothetical protein n=1 Tax=Acytostelium subglobosum LB1 TaxID=1410327 RepID=UPI000644B813|nr:hypothetical protein SAMD00019534_049140 [Acytostelium subglobosum LB1]GAM21739.1 hypothetical protein SAMD00019534_049140 [Acytostelium subglobosum LB1]|eukprot:XP_012754839.1 hypothetical protein SAMD00019534_049140 [Acytostelium subglobosum LB1]